MSLGDPSRTIALLWLSPVRVGLPALVMLIASLNYPDVKPLPVVAAYLLLSNLAVIPYLRWRRPRRGEA